MGEWDSAEIIPKPRGLEAADNPKNSKRPKRPFKNTDIDAPLNTLLKADETEKKYLKSDNETWATPLRFVKEARDRLAEGAFDEAWVVFDRNGHPAHEAAFALAAETDKPVNIAFSSRSFEQWVLLHFEKAYSLLKQQNVKYGEKVKVYLLIAKATNHLKEVVKAINVLLGISAKIIYPIIAKEVAN
jgi:RloB-like protein